MELINLIEQEDRTFCVQVYSSDSFQIGINFLYQLKDILINFSISLAIYIVSTKR